MTTLEIDAPKVLAAVFDSPKAKVALLRKLLLQSGLSLADLFICDKSTGRAVAKDKVQLKDGLIRKYCKGRRGTSKKCGGSDSDSSEGIDIEDVARDFEDATQAERLAQAEAERRAPDERNTPNAIALVTLAALAALAAIITTAVTLSKKKKPTPSPDQAARLPGVKPVPPPKPTPKPKPKPKPKPTPTKKRRPTTQAEDLYQRLVAAVGLQDRPNVAAVCACLVVALAAAGTVGAVRAGTRKPRDPIKQVLRNYKALLAKQGAFKPDPVTARAKGQTSYEDTGFCLRGVDLRLHRLCKRYAHPDELRYQLLQLTTHRSIFHGRTLLVEHLLRNDGEVRQTCAEMAQAIAHHWRARQLLGVVREKVRRTLRRSSGM